MQCIHLSTVDKYVSMPMYKYASIKICKYASMGMVVTIDSLDFVDRDAMAMDMMYT